MLSICRRMTAVLLVILLATSAAGARQDEPLPDEVSSAYQAFTSALAAGDGEAALAAARSAYDAAERLQVNDATLGILAENYGHIAASMGDSGAAYGAWRSAAEIGENTSAQPVDVAWRWHNAALAAYTEGELRDALRCAGRATDALDEVDDASLVETEFASEIYYLKAKFTADTGRLRLARGPAERSVRLMERQGREPDLMMASAYYIWGVGAVVRSHWEDAHFALHMARDIYDEFDPDSRSFHTAQALRSYAVLVSDERMLSAARTRLDANPLHQSRYSSDADEDLGRDDPPGFVDAEPLRRREPRYPMDAAYTSTEGVVIVRFDITEEGRTENVEVLAEIPSGLFGRPVERAVERWTYQPASLDGVSVRQEGRMTHFFFEMR